MAGICGHMAIEVFISAVISPVLLHCKKQFGMQLFLDLFFSNCSVLHSIYYIPLPCDKLNTTDELTMGEPGNAHGSNMITLLLQSPQSCMSSLLFVIV